MGVAAFVLILRYLTGPLRSENSWSDGLDQHRTTSIAPPLDPERSVPVVGGSVPASWAREHVYVFVLLLVAMLLVFGTELVYVRDSFDNRMNTVFKLYYQAWVLLSLVSAYGVYYLGSGAFVRMAPVVKAGVLNSRAYLSRPVAVAWLLIVAVLVAGAFVYVPAALESRSNGFSGPTTLNGLSYYEQFQPDDAAAIDWLDRNVGGTPVVVEATGGSYSAFGEVAWMTGLPTILGWDFHEIQWRGASIIPIEDERKRDVDTIFTTTDSHLTQDLLNKYAATYVFVGPLEKQAYEKNGTAGLTKFGQFMDVVYKNPGVTIYKIRGGS
jgi:uncharacterized membrane protein